MIVGLGRTEPLSTLVVEKRATYFRINQKMPSGPTKEGLYSRALPLVSPGGGQSLTPGPQVPSWLKEEKKF